MKKQIFFAAFILFTGSAIFSQQQQAKEAGIASYCPKASKKKPEGERWHPYFGLHISTDAELFYVGPSLQAGTDFQLWKRVLVNAYFHYFQDKSSFVEYGGFSAHGRFNTLTGVLLFQGNTGLRTDRSFFLAGGIALQRWRDNYKSTSDSWDDKRTTLIPACRLGYFFPSGQHKITIELNGTGPYSYGWEENGFSGRVTEILTQLSLGGRYIF